MHTDIETMTLDAGADAMQALEGLSTRDTPMAVVRDDEVVGLVSQDDVIKWLTLHRR